jgi:hypothetical protein
MKTEPTINIQDEVSKIHAQYGITEMANYRIEKLFEKYVKQFSPKIKQLEWDGKEELAFFTAKTNIGEYMIDSPHHDGIFMLMYTPDWSYESFLLHTSNSTDELKSFAQCDFEARVKECLIIE